MKKSYLLALVMILVAGAIVLRGGEADIAPYSNFTEAAVTDGNVKLVGYPWSRINRWITTR